MITKVNQIKQLKFKINDLKMMYNELIVTKLPPKVGVQIDHCLTNLEHATHHLEQAIINYK